MDSPSSYRTNRDLFSNHYLDEHLPDTEAWDQLTEDELRDGYARATALFNKQLGEEDIDAWESHAPEGPHPSISEDEQ